MTNKDELDVTDYVKLIKSRSSQSRESLFASLDNDLERYRKLSRADKDKVIQSHRKRYE